jgi:photosystem II stability/assembly factor-like uncharacterized protein
MAFGLTEIPNGYSQSGGPQGGTVNALAIDPSAPATLYAGTTLGVFKSTNRGTNWTAVNSGLRIPNSETPASVNALAIDPATPTTVYAGTYQGVFKSTDRGTNWIFVNFPSSVNSLAIDPSVTGTLYAGTPFGVLKSTDGGTNWIYVNSGLRPGPVNSLAIDPSVPGTLYAGTFSGVFKSTNGGTSWTSVNSGLTVTNIVATIVIDPSTPTTLYAGIPRAGVFKSINGGTSWTPINAGLTATIVVSLAIDPSAPATLYTGTLDGGAFESSDGGASWTAVNAGLTPQAANVLAIDPSTPTTLYVGNWLGVFMSSNRGTSWTAVNVGLTAEAVYALAIDPNTPMTLYAGTSAGVFKSANGGMSWTASHSGLFSTVNALALDPSNAATLYAGINGGVFKSTNGGLDWTAINSGLTATIVNAIAIDPSAPATLYAGANGGVFKSTNGGTSWTAMNSGLTATTVYALAIDPSSPATLYAGTDGGGIFKSNNGGTSWAQVYVNDTVRVLAIDSSTPATVYAGLGRGFGVKSTDGGTSWDVLTFGVRYNGLNNYTYVHALSVDPSDPATLYAGALINNDGGIQKSTDGGTNWISVDSGLSAATINALAIDPSTPGTLYAGTYFGVFKSINGGASWHGPGAGSSNGLPAFAVANRGGMSSTSSGSGSSISVGYGEIRPNSGTTTPSGIAILSNRQNNILVSEVGVPATPALSSGRMYAEIAGALNAGLAIANPNDSPVIINFYFTDADGNAAGSGSTTIGAHQQSAQFLDQSPYNVYSTTTFQGTFSFTSSLPVAVVALRGFTNERGEFLMSTLPVIDTSVPPNTGTLVASHFVDGGGWTTNVLLVNPTDNPISGTIQFLNQAGTAANVTIGNQTSSSFTYAIPRRTSQKLSTSGQGPMPVVAGSIRIVPSGGGTSPTPLIVFSNRPDVITVSEAGVPVTSGTAFRTYVEVSGVTGLPGNINSGIAVANLSPTPAVVTFDVTDLTGASVSGILPVTITLPAAGQAAKFLSEIFPSLRKPFQGVLRITTASSGLSVVGLRTRINERYDFLITTTPPTNESAPAPTAPLYFPQVADGGGFTTQFILFSGVVGQVSSGTLNLIKQDGSPFGITFN